MSYASTHAASWRTYMDPSHNMSFGDWFFVIGYFAIAFGVAVYHFKRSSKDTTHFFQGGRTLSWWVAGTSIAATSFAADTPLAITELVAENGIAGNWLWWSRAFGSTMTVFFFANLWRRSGVLTDVELVELRYEGKGGEYLRAFKAVLFGLVLNSIVCGWVSLAMETIVAIILPDVGFEPVVIVACLIVIVAFFAMTAGLKGLAVTDNFQFVITTVGSILLAHLAVNNSRIGGISGLMDKLSPDYFHMMAEVTAVGPENKAWQYTCPTPAPAPAPAAGLFTNCTLQATKNSLLHGFFVEQEPGALVIGQQRCYDPIAANCTKVTPVFVAGKLNDVCMCDVDQTTGHASLSVVEMMVETWGVLTLSASAFVAQIGIQWWSSWYPTAEPGGGGYMSQRLMACRSERHSTFAALWFTVAHYCVRPWPWIITALVAQVLYPDLSNPREGYVLVMREILPNGLRGFLFAASVAGYMSTIATQLNWGTAYLVNDLFRRFVFKNKHEVFYIGLARMCTIVVAATSIAVTTSLTSITQAWELVITSSAGVGTVLIARWYWWRINAWSELTATLVPIVLATIDGVLMANDIEVSFITKFPGNLYFFVIFTTVSWVLVTFQTDHVPFSTLDHFYRTVRPRGPGWGPIAARNPETRAEIAKERSLIHVFVDWGMGVVLVYSILFGVGSIIFQKYAIGVVLLLLAAPLAALWISCSFDSGGRDFFGWLVAVLRITPKETARPAVQFKVSKRMSLL